MLSSPPPLVSTKPRSCGVVSAVASSEHHSPAKLQIRLRKLKSCRKRCLPPEKLDPDLEKEVRFCEEFERKKKEVRVDCCHEVSVK